jgi:D-alanyl-D-alanine carboxypeptidase/D-alanyl-D-alanine-endopeptidase (penicillin-binding protein 4)
LVFSVWLVALPTKIESFLKESKLPSKDVSIYIKELGTERVIASHYTDKVRKPASVVKVLTTYSSLLKLGFDYRWPTEFYRDGSVHFGTLGGDLVIKGYGDPSLGFEDIPEIIAQIKQQGISKIDGDIVIDRSYFDVGDKDSAYFDKYPFSAYNAMPDAMMFNERTSTVCITPKTKSARKELNDPSYEVINKVKFVNRSCRGKYAWINPKVDINPPTPKLILQGELSRYCKEKKVCMIVTKPYKAFFYALKEGLEKEGVTFKGRLKLSNVPRGAKILFTHYSKPLEALVSYAAKESNNVYARHLLLLLGAKVYGAPATVEKGRKAVMEILEDQGLLVKRDLYLDNGSGLSRRSKITAKILSNVLESAYESYRGEWMRTLSIAGVDGTIKKRFRHKPAQDHAWMKTGTLKYVKNIAGYVKNRGGTYYSVVILVNTKHRRSRAEKLQNKIINWLSTTTRTSTQRVKTKRVNRLQDTSVKQGTLTGEYYVQIASLSQKPSPRYLSKIEAAGYAYQVVRYKEYYKILVGGYPDKKSAQKTLPNLRKKFTKDAFIVKH